MIDGSMHGKGTSVLLSCCETISPTGGIASQPVNALREYLARLYMETKRHAMYPVDPGRGGGFPASEGLVPLIADRNAEMLSASPQAHQIHVWISSTYTFGSPLFHWPAQGLVACTETPWLILENNQLNHT